MSDCVSVVSFRNQSFADFAGDLCSFHKVGVIRLSIEKRSVEIMRGRADVLLDENRRKAQRGQAYVLSDKNHRKAERGQTYVLPNENRRKVE